jgi:hypothetical protein
VTKAVLACRQRSFVIIIASLLPPPGAGPHRFPIMLRSLTPGPSTWSASPHFLAFLHNLSSVIVFFPLSH